MPTDYTDKVVLITGARQGIGRATAEDYLAHGAKVMLAGRTYEPLQKLSAELGEDRTAAVHCDVQDQNQVKAAVDATVERFGGLDILFNNAGVIPNGLIRDQDPEEFETVLRTNLFGSYCGIKYAAPAIAARGGGSIINNASVAGTAGIPHLAGYCSAKAALINLTRVAALEYKAENIRVNCVLPGLIDTDLVDDIREPFEAMLGGSLDDAVNARQGRWVTPAEVARVILHLTSDDAIMTSGIAYTIDNAMTASLF